VHLPDQAQRIAIGLRIHELAWLADTKAGQDVLSEAYRGSQRPRCLCVTGGVEMYVGRRGATYYLARMPGSGILHDAACPSVEDVNLFSGAVGYASGVLLELPDGHLVLTFDADTPRQLESPAVSLDGLLDLLLETADLNTWSTDHPQRTWQEVACALSAAAETLHIKNTGPLKPSLLLPAPFDKSSYDRLRPQQETFLSMKDGLGLVCAPLREIKPTAYGWQLVLKHLPRTKFWINRKVGEALEAGSGGTLSFADVEYPALCLAQVRRTTGDGFAVTGLALRRTDRRYLPCLSLPESDAADLLAERGIAHLRPLRFDLPWDAPLCDYALTEGRRTPAPVFVLDDTGCQALDYAKQSAYRVLAGGPMDARCVEKTRWTPPLPAVLPAAAHSKNILADALTS
jgi:hypothetical protein